MVACKLESNISRENIQMASLCIVISFHTVRVENSRLNLHLFFTWVNKVTQQGKHYSKRLLIKSQKYEAELYFKIFTSRHTLLSFKLSENKVYAWKDKWRKLTPAHVILLDDNKALLSTSQFLNYVQIYSQLTHTLN